MSKQYQSLYQLEYSIIPRFIEMFKRGKGSIDLITDIKLFEKSMSDRAMYIDWNSITIDIYGSPENDDDFIICYTFPKPFQIPLAKYGVVYIDTTNRISNYYTLEKSSFNYFLGSMNAFGMHLNFGERPDMTQDEFIMEIRKMEEKCSSQRAEEKKRSFLQRIKRFFNS